MQWWLVSAWQCQATCCPCLSGLLDCLQLQCCAFASLIIWPFTNWLSAGCFRPPCTLETSSTPNSTWTFWGSSGRIAGHPLRETVGNLIVSMGSWCQAVITACKGLNRLLTPPMLNVVDFMWLRICILRTIYPSGFHNKTHLRLCNLIQNELNVALLPFFWEHIFFESIVTSIITFPIGKKASPEIKFIRFSVV